MVRRLVVPEAGPSAAAIAARAEAPTGVRAPRVTALPAAGPQEIAVRLEPVPREARVVEQAVPSAAVAAALALAVAVAVAVVAAMAAPAAAPAAARADARASPGALTVVAVAEDAWTATPRAPSA